MSIIPLHLQRRFEQRWAVRFSSLVIPAATGHLGVRGPNAGAFRALNSMSVDPSGVGNASKVAPLPPPRIGVPNGAAV
ncbi:MAG: hypothetical protein JWR80_123 [Bradyrhizobium sp.]|nr:hypothetical protein [Bradyrhizobium sp.]